MDSRRVMCLIAWGGVVLLALALRFYQLGERPFHDDELATFGETDSLMHGPASPLLTSEDRLPRAVPISYGVHWLDYTCFGRSERGSRVLSALLGSLTVLMIVAGMALAGAGTGTALLAGTFVALWPQHIYFSQQNRFYITAYCTAALCMLAGTASLRGRSQLGMILASAVGLMGVLCHTTLLLLLPGLLGAVAMTALLGRDRSVWRLGVAPAIAVVVGCGLYLFYVRPLLQAWNAEVGWGLGPAGSLGAAAFKVGWPTLLLAGTGAVLALARRNEQDCYWLAWGGVWLGACLTMPLVMEYHSAYSFPPSLGLFVLAALSVAQIARYFAPTSALTATAWVGAACLLNLPALVSHYIDGSCPDYRAAGTYIRATGKLATARWPPRTIC